MEIRPVGTELFLADGRTDGRKDGRTDGRTDMSKLTVACRNFVNAPNDTGLHWSTDELRNEVYGEAEEYDPRVLYPDTRYICGQCHSPIALPPPPPTIRIWGGGESGAGKRG